MDRDATRARDCVEIRAESISQQDLSERERTGARGDPAMQANISPLAAVAARTSLRFYANAASSLVIGEPA